MKTIPCFSCKRPVEVRDRNAIAKLCSDCNTPDNQEILRNTPVRHLLRNLDEGISDKVEKLEGEYRDDFAKVNEELNIIADKIASLKTKIDIVGSKEPTVIKETTEKPQEGVMNEYGEIV